MSRDTVHKIIKDLKRKKYISSVIQPDRATLEYKLLSKLVTDTIRRGTAENDRGLRIPSVGGTAENDTRTINKRTINIEKENKQKKKDSPDKIPYVAILDYLKLKAKLPKGFSATSGNKKFINARWGEGHRLVDFKSVIDVKCDEWLGTKWAKFLRPKTLFNSENFDSYLNQQAVKTNEAPGECL